MNLILIIICGFFILFQGRNFDGLKEMAEDKEYIFDSYTHLTELEEFPNVCDRYDNENCAEAWLKEMDKVMQRNRNRINNINFKYSVDMNEKNRKLKMKFLRQIIKIQLRLKEKVNKFRWHNFSSSLTRRTFQLFTTTIESKNESISEMVLDISQKMKNIYNHGRPCFDNLCLAEGEADIVSLFRRERDYDKLLGFWSAWRNVTGRKSRHLFVKKMELENIGATEHGYLDAASFELERDFEETNFNETIARLFDDILPLYKQLHAYVRFCLHKYYRDKFDRTGPIPAHILGDLWAQQWTNIMPIILSCQGETTTHSMQGEVNKKLRLITVNDMFRKAEKFYQSTGLYGMSKEFWERSVFAQRPGKLMDCHGSATDFHNGYDYRIKMCTTHTMNGFDTIHHEMGHVQYYMAYKHLHYAFQDSANPGFHEAIGDTVALSVKTPEHLKQIGFIQHLPTSTQFDIEYLLLSALEKVAFLPFAITMDSYIWSVYNGSVPTNKLNEHWWNLRYQFQGLKPPLRRTEDDFDPAAKYHISFGVSYIRYFVSFILQFQFYESMCQLSGHDGPLHRCDFYGSKAAGEKLLMMLQKGKSQHWRETLSVLTGSRDLTSMSLMKFFEPLYVWLKDTNKRLQIPIGW